MRGQEVAQPISKAPALLWAWTRGFWGFCLKSKVENGRWRHMTLTFGLYTQLHIWACVLVYRLTHIDKHAHTHKPVFIVVKWGVSPCILWYLRVIKTNKANRYILLPFCLAHCCPDWNFSSRLDNMSEATRTKAGIYPPLHVFLHGKSASLRKRVTWHDSVSLQSGETEAGSSRVLWFDVNHSWRAPTSEIWSSADWEGFRTCRGGLSLEEVGLWGWALRRYSPPTLPVQSLLPDFPCTVSRQLPVQGLGFITQLSSCLPHCEGLCLPGTTSSDEHFSLTLLLLRYFFN